LKIFWPYRSEANGFSIQKLARKYRLKISNASSSEISNQLLDNKNSTTSENNKISIASPLHLKKIHWANRDFSEYKESA
tara:strand:+ start:66 stop:302 length:237 start_codon:yes stop_codon:yes gene_type:complete